MPAQITVSLVTPRVPRFVRIGGTLGYVSIDSLTTEELEGLAVAWREQLHEAAIFYRTAHKEADECTSDAEGTAKLSSLSRPSWFGFGSLLKRLGW